PGRGLLRFASIRARRLNRRSISVEITCSSLRRLCFWPMAFAEGPSLFVIALTPALPVRQLHHSAVDIGVGQIARIFFRLGCPRPYRRAGSWIGWNTHFRSPNTKRAGIFRSDSGGYWKKAYQSVHGNA